LLLKDMSIYSLQKAFERSLSLFYSGSMGSIQFAVRKLLESGEITSRESHHGKRRSKIYSVTAKGRAHFFEAMYEPIPESKLETTALARTSFLGLLPNATERERVLSIIVDSIRESLQQLETLESELENEQVPEGLETVFYYRTRPLDYGMHSHRHALAFFERLRDAERHQAARE
jgi:DNA-binding PadR family transcriptional regulator